MKKTKMTALFMGMAAMAAFSFTACSKKPAETTAAPTKAESVQETTAAAGAGTAAAAEKKETETKAEVASEKIKAIEFKTEVYRRDYPNAEYEEGKMFSASADLITILSDGYPELKASLEDFNERSVAFVDGQFATEAKTFGEGDIQEWEYEMMPYTDDSLIGVRRADSILFSFSDSVSSWYGGAHPSSYSVGYTWDAKTGEEVSLKDITEDFDGLYAQVIKQLSEYEYNDGFFDDWEQTVDAAFHADDPEINWTAGSDMVYIWFNQYEIAPYATGPVFLDLDLKDKEIAKLFKMEYFPEDCPKVQEAAAAGSDSSVQVEELCHYEDDYKDEVDNYYHYSYSLPHIVGDTPYIQQVNAEIDKILKEDIEPQLEMMKDGTSLFLIDSYYTVGRRDNISSVYLKISTDWDEVLLYTWNFLNDGSKAENKDVFAAFDLSEAEFEENANALAEELAFGKDSDDEEYRKMYEATMASVNKDMPVYVSENQALNCIIGLYVPAGGGYYKECCEIPGTQKRADGRELVSINPQTTENFRLEKDKYLLKDVNDDTEYVLDNDTILVHEIPCFDPALTSMQWMEKYLEKAGDGEGFGMGDILTLLVNKDGHIDVVQFIGWWD